MEEVRQQEAVIFFTAKIQHGRLRVSPFGSVVAAAAWLAVCAHAVGITRLLVRAGASSSPIFSYHLSA